MSSESVRIVKLSRESTRWSQADSAGGFTMRYITAMRNYLIESWGDTTAVDKTLVLLLNHFATKGFGDGGKGKIRDYLLRVTRTAAAAYHRREPSEVAPPVDTMNVGDPNWLNCWAGCLMERVWRCLERKQHAEGGYEYAVLRLATDYPNAKPEELASQVLKKDGQPIDAAQFKQTLFSARTQMAQLIADEVTETLEAPSDSDVKEELNSLGLLRLVEPYTAG